MKWTDKRFQFPVTFWRSVPIYQTLLGPVCVDIGTYIGVSLIMFCVKLCYVLAL